jgi:hypothetical protein
MRQKIRRKERRDEMKKRREKENSETNPPKIGPSEKPIFIPTLTILKT